jgi:hypothetical protein
MKFQIWSDKTMKVLTFIYLLRSSLPVHRPLRVLQELLVPANIRVPTSSLLKTSPKRLKSRLSISIETRLNEMKIAGLAGYFF